MKTTHAMTMTMAAGFVLAMVMTSGLAQAHCGACAAGDDKHDHDHTHDKAKPDVAKVGEDAPTFTLADHAGKTHDLAQLIEDEKTIVLEWFNPQCPYVVKHYKHMSTMKDLNAKYSGKNVVWLLVNSGHQHDADFNAKWAKKWDIQRPILIDQSGQVGRMYAAKTTPHMYIIHEGKLVYAGGIDNDPHPRQKKTGDDLVNYVDQALGQIVAGEEVSVSEAKPYGCSVKYAPKAQAKACTHCDVASKDACQCMADAATDQVPAAVACPCSPKPAKPDSGDEDDQQTA